MAPGAGTPGAPGPCGYPYEGASGGGGVAPGVSEPSSAGETAVFGSWLPPDISAVFASGGVASSALSGGANTVSGSGTERSSPGSALVSVPAQGVAPSGTPGSLGGGVDEDAAPTGTPPCVSGNDPASDVPATAPVSKSEIEAEPEPEPEPPSRRSGTPIRSAASCNHSGGVRRNDV